MRRHHLLTGYKSLSLQPQGGLHGCVDQRFIFGELRLIATLVVLTTCGRIRRVREQACPQAWKCPHTDGPIGRYCSACRGFRSFQQLWRSQVAIRRECRPSRHRLRPVGRRTRELTSPTCSCDDPCRSAFLSVAAKVAVPAPSMASKTTSSPNMNSGANSTRMTVMRLHSDEAGDQRYR